MGSNDFRGIGDNMTWLKTVWQNVLTKDSLEGVDVINELKEIQKQILYLSAQNNYILITDITPQDPKLDVEPGVVTDKKFFGGGLTHCTTTTFLVLISIASDFPKCKIGDIVIELDDNGTKTIEYELPEDTWDITVSLLLPDSTLGKSYTVTWR